MSLSFRKKRPAWWRPMLATLGLAAVALGLSGYESLKEGAGSVEAHQRRVPQAVPSATPKPRKAGPPSPSKPRAPSPLEAGSGPVRLARPLLTFGRPLQGGAQSPMPSPTYPYGTTGGGEYILHHGVDFPSPMGAPVLAVADGEVIYAGEDLDETFGPAGKRYPDGFYGRLIVIRHADALGAKDPDGEPVYSLYGHLSESRVRARQRVRRGEVIGLVGMRGVAGGPHLHLEVRGAARDYGATYNPELFVGPLPGHGVIVGRVTDPAGAHLDGVAINLFRLDEKGQAGWWSGSQTYPGEGVRPLPGLDENFVFGDIEPGRYRVVASAGGGPLTGDVEVQAGQASVLRLTRDLD